MRVSHFASVQVIVPPSEYSPTGTAGKSAQLKVVGMAQNLSVNDNFGTRAESVIGTPLPVLAPGYQTTEVRIEKATIDGADFRNLGAFNPLWAHIGKTYQDVSLVSVTGALSIVDAAASADNGSMYPFMFILAVKNRVANSYTQSNISTDNKPVGPNSTARSNSFGLYACVLQSANISMSSQQAIIMDTVSAVARPISGTWLNQKIRSAFSQNGDAKNGMRDIVHSVLFGYRS
jgi:hypothetical protein